MTAWQSHVWTHDRQCWRCRECGLVTEAIAPPKSECSAAAPAMHRRPGDYAPTPGYRPDDSVWRDPERPDVATVKARTMLMNDAEPLGVDELRVLTLIAQRLAMGQRQYGRLDIARDKRDWREQLGEEAADALVYAAIKVLADDAQAFKGER